MEISSLQTVLAVRDLGSIAAAARRLELDPSTVSRIVAQVEREIGLRVFQRSTRRLAVTEEGEIYLQRIAPLVAELDAARDAARAAGVVPEGTLRMTASVAFAQECILPLLPAFREANPNIRIELLPTDANVDLVEQGLDLAVRLAPRPQGDLITMRLMTTRYRVVAAPAYLEQSGQPGHPRELEARDCLRFSIPEYRTRWRFRQGDEAPEDVPVSGSVIISNALALREAARQAMGPCLLADWLIRRDLQSGRLVDLFPDYEFAATEFDTAAWALYPSRNYLPRKTRAMLGFLQDAFRGRGEG